MMPAQQQVPFDGTAPAWTPTKHRHIRNCQRADPAYGKGVADALGIDLAAVGA